MPEIRGEIHLRRNGVERKLIWLNQKKLGDIYFGTGRFSMGHFSLHRDGKFRFTPEPLRNHSQPITWMVSRIIWTILPLRVFTGSISLHEIALRFVPPSPRDLASLTGGAAWTRTIDISSYNLARLTLYAVEDGRQNLIQSIVAGHPNVIQTEICDLMHPWILAVVYQL